MALIRASVFALLLVAVAIFQSAQGQKIGSSCMGCNERISPYDYYLKKSLKIALKLENAENYKVLEILDAKRRAAYGYNYQVKFKAEVPGRDEITCDIGYRDSLINEPLKKIRVYKMDCK
ncbi:hypothetical protein O3M35_012870 [Rhynocoris fuscipes]|uniref:Uncharacterized protein n=1 Tax=Rhynocoris fuscipes TaxID=488301 RepID=A0AAW1CEP2_9HEMI